MGKNGQNALLVVLACLDASRYDGVKLFDGADVRIVGVELPKHDLDIPGDAVESHVEFVKDVPVDVTSRGIMEVD